MKNFKIAGLAAVSVLFASSAYAADATADLGVSATVAEACVVTTTPVAFGTYDASANVDATGQVKVTCTKGTGYDVKLGAGANAGTGGVAERYMISGTEKLAYALYSDAGYTSNWGETVGTDAVSMTSATGGEEILTVYGRILAGQYVTAGDYADTVTVTVTY